MTKEESISILSKCIQELEETSEEEFQNKMKKNVALSSKYYDEYFYEDDNFSLILSHEYIPKSR